MKRPAHPLMLATKDGSGGEAVMAFLRGYLAMPDDADIEVSLGHVLKAENMPLLIIKVSHPRRDELAIGLPSSDARALADICEATLHRYPSQVGLENLILALRHGADTIDKAGPP